MTRGRLAAGLAASMLLLGVGAGAGCAVYSTSPEAQARSLPACPEEDSPGPCVWDARARGNGQGRSFIAEADGSLTYLDTRTEVTLAEIARLQRAAEAARARMAGVEEDPRWLDARLDFDSCLALSRAAAGAGTIPVRLDPQNTDLRPVALTTRIQIQTLFNATCL